MINPSAAFSSRFMGFSIWEVEIGRYQCSFKRRREQSFVIGHGETPEEAFADVMRQIGGKLPRRREVGDLL